MSSKELFKRFSSLCLKWPKDETKVGRDYGDKLREQFSQHFPHGELSQIKNPEKVEAELSALERLANNSYFNENMLKRSSASGLEAWACREAISNQGIKLFDGDDESTVLKRLKIALNVRFSNTVDKITSDDQESSQKTHKKID